MLSTPIVLRRLPMHMLVISRRFGRFRVQGPHRSRDSGLVTARSVRPWVSERNTALLSVCIDFLYVVPSGTDAFHTVIIFGGALIGFCLAATPMMSVAKVRTKSVPGMSIKTLLERVYHWVTLVAF
jgi:hypothetical protein